MKITSFACKEKAVKSKNSGFTMIEMLTTVTIIAILIAILVPSLSLVRRVSKETAQRSQFATIDMAIGAFKNDYGDYPPSSWQGTPPLPDYSGAQMLSEALVGWDLMGFHPKSDWRANGRDAAGTVGTVYDMTGFTEPQKQYNLEQRKGPYLELATTGVFKLDDLFGTGLAVPLAGQTFVLCDVFKAKKITLTPAAGKTTAVMAGTPILYYKANTSSKTIDVLVEPNMDRRIYNSYDNYFLAELGRMTVPPAQRGWPENRHPIVLNDDPESFYSKFGYEGGIKDPRITTRPWPYRPDSYILISAGMDGLYGTSDDIHNF
jgi:prepilin-type N-terminal cleavage/methylation domain-containing protein